MVESKDFTENPPTEISPPLVSVPAGEPLDVWHLEAVPVVAPALYDYGDTASSFRSLPTIFADDHQDESIATYREPRTHENVHDPAKQGARLAGVLGLVLGGPFLGLILGFGAAMASKRDDAWGDSVRALGHVAVTAQDQARAVNDKHHVMERSRQAAASAWKQARELEVFQTCWKATHAFVQKHKLVEKGVDGLAVILAWTLKQMQQKLNKTAEGEESSLAQVA